MPNAKRSGASRKKDKKARSSGVNGTGSPKPTTSNGFAASPSFTFTNPSSAPSFPHSPSHSPSAASASTSKAPFSPSTGKKRFAVPTAHSSDGSDDSEDYDSAEEDEDEDDELEDADDDDDDEMREADDYVPDSELSPEKRADLAAKEKEKGNVHFKQGDYPSATRLYSRAVELDPSEPAYLTNRAASFMGSKLFSKALADCVLALELEKKTPSGVKAKTLLRLAKCQLALGLVTEASRTLDTLVPLDASRPVMNERAKVDKLKSMLANIQRDKDKGDWNMVLYGIDAATREVEESPREWRLWKVEALVGKKRWDEASSLAADVLRANSQQPDALYFRGVALLYQNNHAQAIAHAQAALRADPDFSKARTLLKRVRTLDSLKDEGNAAFKASQWQQAIDKYTEAMTEAGDEHVTFRVTLLSNRATAYSKAGDLTKALADCDACLALDSSWWKAMRTRARIYLQQEAWEDALRDFKAAYELAPAGSADEKALKREVSDAEASLRRSKMKDHYKTLKIHKEATELEIKKAYRQQSLIHHPDKGGSDEKFKEVGEAYAILSDPARRQKFDMGIDESDPMSNMQSDFGGMGGFPGFHSHSGFGGGGGGGMHFEDMFGGGFPGGGRRGHNPYGF